MRLEMLVIGFFVIAIIVAGMYSFVGNLGDVYGVTTDEEERLQIYENTQELGTNINASFTKLAKDDTSKTAQFFTGLVLAWNTLIFIVKSLTGFTSTIVNDVFISIGLPSWFIGIVYSVITTLIVFALLAALLRWRS